MSINSIPHRNKDELDLHHLQVLDVLLREHGLTRAAKVLSVTQPALSKTLARLRRYFDDPLFVRVALRMEPTPKALELKAPVERHPRSDARLSSEHVPFNPLISSRTFNFCVVDAGVIKLLAAAGDAARRTGAARSPARDAARVATSRFLAGVGQDRFRHGLVSRTDEGNPPPAALGRALRERGAKRPPANFARKFRSRISRRKNTCWSRWPAPATRINSAERALEAAIPPDNIICRVPIFLGRSRGGQAHRRHRHAAVFDRDGAGRGSRSRTVTPPIKLPKIEISQYWHERLPPRAGQRMDPFGVPHAVPQAGGAAGGGRGGRIGAAGARSACSPLAGAPYGNRTRVFAVRGRRPGPLDEGSVAFLLAAKA